MLRLELVSNMQKEAVYNYFPEQENEYGTVSINKATGEIEVIKISLKDVHRWYLMHAVSTIRRYAKENHYPEKDVVAWY